MEDLAKKITDLEEQVKKLCLVIERIGGTDIHNFTLLDNKIDEKIKSATKEIIEAISKSK